MAACRQCSTEIPNESRFCPSCGTAVASSDPDEAPESPQPQAPQPYRYEQAYQPQPRTPHPSGLRSDVRNMAMLIHLSAFSGLVIPFGHVLGPLLVWLLKREESPFIDMHGKAALNFQISMTIYYIISAILIFLVIGFFMLIAIWIFSVIVTIIAAIRASNGEEYQYPIAIKFMS